MISSVFFCQIAPPKQGKQERMSSGWKKVFLCYTYVFLTHSRQTSPVAEPLPFANDVKQFSECLSRVQHSRLKNLVGEKQPQILVGESQLSRKSGISVNL